MKETIVRAARNLFARKGYAGTSMREIAQAVQITKAALYYHFPDKKSLYREAMKATLRYFNERVGRAVRGITDPVARIRAVVHAKLRQFLDERDLIRFLYNQLFMPEDPSLSMSSEIRDSEQELRDAVHACAEEGFLLAKDVDATTTLLTGAVEYCGARWLLDPSARKPTPAMGDRLLALAIPGLSERLKRMSGRKKPWRKSPSRPVRRPRQSSRSSVSGLALLFLSLWSLGPSLAQEPATSERLSPFEGGLSEEVVAIPGGGETLTLGECVAEALEANADLQALRYRKDELNAVKLQAISTGLPTLDLSGSWSRGRDPSFALDETFGGGGDTEDSILDSLFGGGLVPAPEDIPAQTFWRASLNATWELRPGRVYNAVGAAGYRLRQHDAAVTDAEHRTAEQVVHTYHDVLSAAERVEALQAEVESRREFLDISRRRLLVEFATPLDTLQAAVSLANLGPQLRRAKQELRNAGARLNVLMGRPTLSPVTVRGAPEVEAEEIDPEWALSRVEKRPDIVQLSLMDRVLQRTRATQKAINHPYLSAEASYGYVGRTFDTITDTGHDFWNARVSLSLPIFDGLLTKGEVQETEAAIRRTRREREEAIRQARLEILTLLGDLEAARQNLSAANLNLTLAEDALARMQQKYAVGKAEYLEVLNAQSERFTARSEQIVARSEVSTLTASVKRALGMPPVSSFTGGVGSEKGE